MCEYFAKLLKEDDDKMFLCVCAQLVYVLKYTIQALVQKQVWRRGIVRVIEKFTL